jgi:uncharacterized protein (TIGR02453 family)
VSNAPPVFTGFTHEALQFLVDLAGNNERSWFQPRRAEFERLLKEPLEALCVALADRFEARGIPLRSDPSRSPFRIYRDVRFSKDKSPYKTNISAEFPWVGPIAGVGPGPGDGTEPRRLGPGAYFSLSPAETYLGGGAWHPDPGWLAAFRRAVDTEPERVLAAFGDPGFRAHFAGVDGERLKRVPAGFPADHPHAELLRLKDVTFGRQLSDEDVFSPDLPDILADNFAAAVPVLALLASLEVNHG